jgi:hypothetical protein
MKIICSKIFLSASDLSTYIACPHATWLSLQEAGGKLKAPQNINAALHALQQKGEAFEAGYIQQLKESGKTIIEIDRKAGREKALQDTINAMKQGADIIYQARLEHDIWNGWADFLRRVETPSQTFQDNKGRRNLTNMSLL